MSNMFDDNTESFHHHHTSGGRVGGGHYYCHEEEEAVVTASVGQQAWPQVTSSSPPSLIPIGRSVAPSSPSPPSSAEEVEEARPFKSNFKSVMMMSDPPAVSDFGRDGYYCAGVDDSELESILHDSDLVMADEDFAFNVNR